MGADDLKRRVDDAVSSLKRELELVNEELEHRTGVMAGNLKVQVETYLRTL